MRRRCAHRYDGLTLSNPAWTVRTGRLLLAPVAWHDLPELQALKADPAVFAQMLGGVRNPGQTAHDLADDISFWAAHSVGLWTVREPGHAPLLGLTGIHDRPDGRGFGLRFAFRPLARGRGYAREAAAAALRHAHDAAGLKRVVAVTKQSNFESRTVLGAIGMRPVETFLRHDEPMLLFASDR